MLRVMYCAVLSFFVLLGCSSAATLAAPVELKTESVPEPIFNSKVFIQQSGREHKDTLVFVHGLGDNGARDWDAIIAALANRFHIVTFDLPGFGRSERKNADYSPESYSRFLHWVVTNYTGGHVTLVGHSMGGAISLYYAAQHPEVVQRLILFDAAGVLHRGALLRFMTSVPEDGPGNTKLMQRSAAQVNEWVSIAIVKGEALSQQFGGLIDESAVRNFLVKDTPTTIAGAALVATDFSAIIPKTTSPVFLIWGERDRVAPLRTGLVLERQLASVQLVTIADAAHVPMRESPQRALALVEEFLRADDPPWRATPPPTSIPRNAPELHCENKHGVTFTGVFSRVTIDKCEDVRLSNVTTTELVVKHSKLDLVNVRVTGNGTAARISNSILIGTNIEWRADIGLDVTDSRMDLAGANLSGSRHSIISHGASVIVCSLCQLGGRETSRPWHGVFELSDAVYD